MSLTRRNARGVAILAIALGAVLAIRAGSSGGAPPAARPGAAATPITRYSLAEGCWAVRSNGQLLAPDTGAIWMQATALGRYLLYDPNRRFVADTGGIGPVAKPSPAAEWLLDGAAPSFTIRNVATGRTLPASFAPATGCAAYPEAGVDATGTPFAGASPEAEVKGTIDAHAHITAFEFIGGDFHCGRPWHPYGVPYALPDCASIHTGTNAAAQDFLDYGEPAHPHDTVGWPTFRDWPKPTSLSTEGDYYTGLARAWKAGLRVFVTELVDNEALCSLMTMRRNPCNDMDAVRLQAQDLRDLQDYIDAQSGGPGKGWFRIVTDPFQARKVINEGKLAVVEGIEVSRIFGCGEVNGASQCTPAQVDAGIKEVEGLGVRTFFPVHKFDNAFGGTKMDAGELGVLINLANRLETGHFWDVKPCTGPEHDSQQIVPPVGGALGELLNGPLRSLLQGAALPVYAAGPSCNQRGLTSLGADLIQAMVSRHDIVEIDHMDAKTADDALAILEGLHAPGVISAHSWDSPQENAGIYRTGGFVTPAAGSSPTAFVAQWRDDRQMAGNAPFFGFGYGSDMNGLAEQTAPTAAHPIGYPFKSYLGDVTFDRERWGDRTFDLNSDGVANYGMYADWLQELQVLAGKPIMDDMFRGAEGYLRTWERTVGVPAASCPPAHAAFTRRGLRALRIGATPERTLFAAGQPTSRPGRSFSYCGSVRAVFDSAGHLALVASTARGHRAGRIHPGTRAAVVRRHARSLGHGVWLRHRLRGGRRYVFGVRRGRVRFVAVVSRSDAARRARLRADLRAAGL
jgi:hypothetical protein